jgi:WD40 repeat protein
MLSYLHVSEILKTNKKSELLMKNCQHCKGKMSPLSISTFWLIVFTLFSHLQIKAQTEVVIMQHDNTRIRELAFGAGGKALIVRSGDEVQVNSRGIVTSPSIHVWEMDGKRKTMAIADREYGRAAVIARDGSLLAFREKNSINVMDMTSKRVVSTVKFEDNKFSRPIAFCNEKRGLVVEQGNKCLIYDIQNSEARFIRDYSAPGLSHMVSNDDAYAIETFGDSFRLMDFRLGKTLHEFPMVERGKSEELRGVAISPENRFIATCSDNKVRLWDMLSNKQVHTFNILPKDNIFCFSPDGRYLIGGSDTLKIWELRGKKEIATPMIAEGKVSAVTMSQDGKFLACGDTKGNIRLWEFSEENMSSLFFTREIRNEREQIRPKGEFEKEDDYQKRKQKVIRSISNKYLSQYVDKTTNEKTVQEQWIEESDIVQQEQGTQIANSRRTIEFRIDSITTYNADKETFNIKLVNEKEKYSKWETIKVPIRDNAQCFKQRAATLVVTGITQLLPDLRTYEIFNIKIKSNCSGKDKDYTFGPQRRYLDE